MCELRPDEEEEEEETVTQGRRKWQNEKLFNMYRAPSIIKNTKARTMIWAEHTARLREKRNSYRALVKKPEQPTWKT